MSTSPPSVEKELDNSSPPSRKSPEPHRSTAKLAILCTITVSLVVGLYLGSVTKPPHVSTGQSWIQQVIDTRFVIAILRTAVVAGVFFILLSAIAALIDNRLLEGVLGARLEKAKVKLITAKSELDAVAVEEDNINLRAQLNETKARLDKARTLASDRDRKLGEAERKSLQIAGFIEKLEHERDALAEQLAKAQGNS